MEGFAATSESHPQGEAHASSALCPPTGWRGRERGPRVEALRGSTALSALKCLSLDVQQERGTDLYSVKITLCWGVCFSRSAHSLYRSILTHTSTSQGFKSSSDPARFDSCYNPVPSKCHRYQVLKFTDILGSVSRLRVSTGHVLVPHSNVYLICTRETHIVLLR